MTGVINFLNPRRKMQRTISIDDPLYSVSEVAALLKVTPRTVFRRVAQGLLPPLHPTIHRMRGDQLRQMLETGMSWQQLSKKEPAQNARIARKMGGIRG